MLKIEKLSSANSDDISGLIYEFQQDHFEKYGSYYALIPDAQEKIKSIISKSVRKRKMGVFIVYANDQPAGYIFLRVDTNIPIYDVSRYGYISGLFVRESHREKGVATALLEHGLSWFRKKDVRRLELKVNVSNDLGMEFWNKNGFTDQQILMVKEI